MNSDQFTPRFPFADWPNPGVPAVAAGVYAIWKDSVLIYCGMSGRAIDTKAKASPKKYGLITRLNSHASVRLSGDQFCVYVAKRFVIPSLKTEELSLFESGGLTLDARSKTFIHEHHIGEISHPQNVQCRCLEITVHFVFRARQGRVAIRCFLTFIANNALYFHLIHQSHHRAPYGRHAILS